MRYVSKSVMTGFVNALAILIFMAQLPELDPRDVTWLTYVLVAAGLAIIYLFPLLTTAIPLAAGHHRRPDGAGLRPGARRAHRGRHGRPARHAAGVPDPRHPAQSRDAGDHLPLFRRGRRRGPSRKPDDAEHRRRPDRHEVEPQPGMRGPGSGQHRHGLHRRHGGLRDDRPVHHQREIRRARAAVVFRGGRVPPDPRGGSWRSGQHHSHASPGGDHDHGLDRHVLMVLDQEPRRTPALLLHRDDRDGGDRGLHPQPRHRRAGGRAFVGGSSSPARSRSSSPSAPRSAPMDGYAPITSKVSSFTDRSRISWMPSTSGRPPNAS